MTYVNLETALKDIPKGKVRVLKKSIGEELYDIFGDFPRKEAIKQASAQDSLAAEYSRSVKYIAVDNKGEWIWPED